MTMAINKIRPIAYYLPQFHPIPENDEWWGKGFTEWTNVTKAKPLFDGHKQPHFPSELGYYDLRIPEVREQQAQLARDAGIEGFCYWHYWFGNGKRLLERPFKEVLESGKPDFPFCLGWANETWSGIWHGASDKILVKQEYPGKQDYEQHFHELLPAFVDKRYIRVDDKPLFLIYNPTDLPDMKEFCNIFKELAIKNGLKGLHLVANSYHGNPLSFNPSQFGFDSYTISGHDKILHVERHYQQKAIRKPLIKRIQNFSKRKVLEFFNIELSYPMDKPANVFTFEQAMKHFLFENKYDIDLYPSIITGWDNSPRSGMTSQILTDYNPDLFRIHVRKTLKKASDSKNVIVFIKSWNEWAEGNYLEPEQQYGKAFLNVLKEVISGLKANNELD